MTRRPRKRSKASNDCAAPSKRICGQPRASGDDLGSVDGRLARIVADYRKRFGDDSFYRNQRNLTSAIRVASGLEAEGGKMHPHQRRVGRVRRSMGQGASGASASYRCLQELRR